MRPHRLLSARYQKELPLEKLKGLLEDLRDLHGKILATVGGGELKLWDMTVTGQVDR